MEWRAISGWVVATGEPKPAGNLQLKDREPHEILLAVKTLLEIHDRMQDGKPYNKGRLQ